MITPGQSRFSLRDLCEHWKCQTSLVFDRAAKGLIEMRLELFDVREEKLERDPDSETIATETFYHGVIDIPASEEVIRGLQRHQDGGLFDFIEVERDEHNKSRYRSVSAKSFDLDRDSLFVTVDSVQEYDERRGELLANTVNMEGHVYRPKELIAAIEAWTELYSAGEPKGRKIRTQEIKNWLRTKYPDRDYLSDNAIKRIAMVVNPFKGGGATPTDI